jgi:hypothetical protein
MSIGCVRIRWWRDSVNCSKFVRHLKNFFCFELAALSTAPDDEQENSSRIDSISWNTETMWSWWSLTPPEFHRSTENIFVLGQKRNLFCIDSGLPPSSSARADSLLHHQMVLSNILKLPCHRKWKLNRVISFRVRCWALRINSDSICCRNIVHDSWNEFKFTTKKCKLVQLHFDWNGINLSGFVPTKWRIFKKIRRFRRENQKNNEISIRKPHRKSNFLTQLSPRAQSKLNITLRWHMAQQRVAFKSIEIVTVRGFCASCSTFLGWNNSRTIMKS